MFVERERESCRAQEWRMLQSMLVRKRRRLLLFSFLCPEIHAMCILIAGMPRRISRLQFFLSPSELQFHSSRDHPITRCSLYLNTPRRCTLIRFSRVCLPDTYLQLPSTVFLSLAAYCFSPRRRRRRQSLRLLLVRRPVNSFHRYCRSRVQDELQVRKRQFHR